MPPIRRGGKLRQRDSTVRRADLPNTEIRVRRGSACAKPSALLRPIVIILVGIPGSGKSTFVRALAKYVREHRGECPWQAVSQDVLGTRAKCVAALGAALAARECAVVDRCNVTEEQRRHWVRVAKPLRSWRALDDSDGASQGENAADCGIVDGDAFAATPDAALVGETPVAGAESSVASLARSGDGEERAPLAAGRTGRSPPPFLVALHLTVDVETCVGRVMRRRGHRTLPPSRKSAAVVRRFAEALSAPTSAEGFDLVLSSGARKHDEVLRRVFDAASLAGDNNK